MKRAVRVSRRDKQLEPRTNNAPGPLEHMISRRSSKAEMSSTYLSHPRPSCMEPKRATFFQASEATEAAKLSSSGNSVGLGGVSPKRLPDTARAELSLKYPCLCG